MMGNKTSRVVHKVTKPIRDYNIDERAHKAALRSKDVAAPKHPSTVTHISRAIDNIPQEVKKTLHAADSRLDERLKKVFVTSRDQNLEIARERPGKPLPFQRVSYEMPEFGYHEPSSVPYGRVTLRNALGFISKHQENKQVNSAETIARQYKMDTTVVENILKYFGTFRLVVPNNMSPREKKLFQRLQASSSSLPATPELRSLLGGIPISTSGKKPADAIPFEKSSGKTASEEIYKTRLAEEMEPLRLKKDPSMPGIPDQGMHRLIKDVKIFKEKANKNAKNPPESGSDSTESTAKGSSGLEETALESTAKGSSGLEETALGSTAKGSSALVNSGLEETALEESSEDLKSSGPYKFVSRNPRKKTPKGDKKDPRNPISKDGTDGDVS